jgi:hypothetical protein
MSTREAGQVWMADVEPWRLFARVGDDGRAGEHEYVIDRLAWRWSP